MKKAFEIGEITVEYNDDEYTRKKFIEFIVRLLLDYDIRGEKDNGTQ